MMRAIEANDEKKLSRILRHFQWALLAVLVGTVAVAIAVLTHWPQLLLVHYQMDDVMLVLGFSAAIMAARSLRTPLAVLLQAAGDFKLLARIGGWSALVSVISTLALLLTLGPITSLGGILAGDITILITIWAVTRRLKLSDGKLVPWIR
jgi:O-antigen/teichoic acid export membrane protein